MVETLDGILGGKMSRRDFLKLCGTAVAAALLGCSGKSGSSGSSESFAPAPSLGGRPELEHPAWVKPPSSDIISKIEKIGKQYIEVYAPVEKVLAFLVERNGKRIGVYPWEIREGDVIVASVWGPSTEDLNTLSRSELEEIGKRVALFYTPIGDDDALDKNIDKMKPIYIKPFGRDLAKFVRFVNKEFGEVYGLILIEGVVGNDVIGSYTFVEKGCGKVASCVGTYNLKDPWNTARFYGFTDWNMLNNMMFNILKDGSPAVTEFGKAFLRTYAERWYEIPGIAVKIGGWRKLHEWKTLEKLGVKIEY